MGGDDRGGDGAQAVLPSSPSRTALWSRSHRTNCGFLDTSIWVDVERGKISPGDVAAITGDEPVYLVPPVLAELEYGVHQAASPAQRNRRASAVARIKTKPCIVIDKETGAMFGRLAADLDGEGRPRLHRVQDVWIAAIAIQHNLKVLTQNKRDFADIPGLQLITLSG